MKKAGIGAIKNKNIVATRYKEKKNELDSDQLTALKSQVAIVRKSLEEFAFKHKDKIKKNPEFRQHFQSMCASIGVDPLCYSKGSWSAVLGLGDFYYTLGIKVVEICLVYQAQNGGLMLVDDVVKILNQKKSASEDFISSDDVLNSIKQLKCLGTAFSVIKPSNTGNMMIQSLPVELSLDTTLLIGLSESSNGCLTIPNASLKLNWSEERTQSAFDQLVKDGLAWVDCPTVNETIYWIPSLFNSLTCTE